MPSSDKFTISAGPAAHCPRPVAINAARHAAVQGTALRFRSRTLFLVARTLLFISSYLFFLPFFCNSYVPSWGIGPGAAA